MKVRCSISVLFTIIILSLTSCSFFNDKEDIKKIKSIEEKLSFSKVSNKISNITFDNHIKESPNLNYYSFPYIYAGAGLAVGDINNDNLPDIYFAGNMVNNVLYLNKGDLSFSDISQKAKVSAGEVNRWVTGVSMADVNNDGWLDIYVCVSGPFKNRNNLLFINNKDLTFTESAKEFGLADSGFSTQSSFFDYDLDGDLDMYLSAYPPCDFQSPNTYYAEKNKNPHALETDRLYRNENF